MAIDPKLLQSLKKTRTPTLKKSYAVGNSTFLDNLQTQVVSNHVNTAETDNVTYYGVIMASYRSDEDPTKVASVGNASESYYTIIVKIPGLHDYLPDPTKYKNPMPILEMYPRFVGKLESDPQVGGIATVTFLDPTSKQMLHGNGRILEVSNPGVTGVPAIADGNNSTPPISGMSSLKQKNCRLKNFKMIPPIDDNEQPMEMENTASPKNPPTVNSSYKSSPSKKRETGDMSKPNPSSPDSLESQNDLRQSTNVSDCTDKFLMSDYIDGFQYLNNINIDNPDGVYPRYPLATSGWIITSGFGTRIHPIRKTVKFHTGFDLAGTNITGIPVLSSLPGKVVKSQNEGASGQLVIIHHEQLNLWTLYMHLKARFVKEGDLVGYGTTIGEVNNTGGSTGPHLHFEIRKTRFGKKPHQLIDPEIFLKTKYRYFTSDGFGETNLRGLVMTQEEATKQGIDGLNKRIDISNVSQRVGLGDDL